LKDEGVYEDYAERNNLKEKQLKEIDNEDVNRDIVDYYCEASEDYVENKKKCDNLYEGVEKQEEEQEQEQEAFQRNQEHQEEKFKALTDDNQEIENEVREKLNQVIPSSRIIDTDEEREELEEFQEQQEESDNSSEESEQSSENEDVEVEEEQDVEQEEEEEEEPEEDENEEEEEEEEEE
jgi:hypothetical protein